DDNKDFYSSKRSSSTSVNHKKLRSKPCNIEHDSRRERKLFNNHNSASHRRGSEKDREGHRIDRGLSTKVRQTDRERDRGDHREKKHSNNDSISKNKGSSVGIHCSKTTPPNQTHQSQLNSWKPTKLNVINDEDDNITPLGQISSSKTNSFCATSTSLHTRLLSADKPLSEKVEYGSSYKGSEDNYPIGKRSYNEKKSEMASDEEVPIGQLSSR
ncbi:8286_t:CDS:2, partial [Funneliformis mosseae]